MSETVWDLGVWEQACTVAVEEKGHASVMWSGWNTESKGPTNGCKTMTDHASPVKPSQKVDSTERTYRQKVVCSSSENNGIKWAARIKMLPHFNAILVVSVLFT